MDESKMSWEAGLISIDADSIAMRVITPPGEIDMGVPSGRYAVPSRWLRGRYIPTGIQSMARLSQASLREADCLRSMDRFTGPLDRIISGASDCDHDVRRASVCINAIR